MKVSCVREYSYQDVHAEKGGNVLYYIYRCTVPSTDTETLTSKKQAFLHENRSNDNAPESVMQASELEIEKSNLMKTVCQIVRLKQKKIPFAG